METLKLAWATDRAVRSDLVTISRWCKRTMLLKQPMLWWSHRRRMQEPVATSIKALKGRIKFWSCLQSLMFHEVNNFIQISLVLSLKETMRFQRSFESFRPIFLLKHLALCAAGGRIASIPEYSRKSASFSSANLSLSSWDQSGHRNLPKRMLCPPEMCSSKNSLVIGSPLLYPFCTRMSWNLQPLCNSKAIAGHSTHIKRYLWHGDRDSKLPH